MDLKKHSFSLQAAIQRAKLHFFLNFSKPSAKLVLSLHQRNFYGMNITYRIILSILIYSACFATLLAEDTKRELRGVWIATVWGIDWPQKQGTTHAIQKAQKTALTKILDQAADMNLNMVCFQVRGMADAMYESSLEPWSSFVSGKRGVSPGWDPLQWVVDECHRRGMECHAWVNPFRWSSGTKYTSAPDLKWQKNGWLMTVGKNTIFNPGIEEVRQHVVEVCREIITKYEVDGLIFDDYFYPQGITETADAPDYKLYKATGTQMSIGEWRRANIHKTIADVNSMISDVRPDVRFGISPAGVAGKSDTSAPKYGVEAVNVKAADWQWTDIYSDPVGWLYQRTVDFVSPQLYWPLDHPTAPFEPLAQWWNNTAKAHGRHFFSSHTLADYKGKALPPSEFSRQVEMTRHHNLDSSPGFIFYSAKFLNRLDPDMFEAPALLPPMTWKAVPVLPSPSGVFSDGKTLTWDPVAAPVVSRCDDADCKAIVKYAVYAVPKNISKDKATGEDGISVEYFLGIAYDNSFTLPTTCRRGYKYAVTALDGYGIESGPSWND